VAAIVRVNHLSEFRHRQSESKFFIKNGCPSYRIGLIPPPQLQEFFENAKADLSLFQFPLGCVTLFQFGSVPLRDECRERSLEFLHVRFFFAVWCYERVLGCGHGSDGRVRPELDSNALRDCTFYRCCFGCCWNPLTC